LFTRARDNNSAEAYAGPPGRNGSR
jgi:hypothetical protein